MFIKQLKSAFFIFLLLTFVTGILYPLAVTAVGRVFFNHQASGSIILKDGKPAGSSLIGQQFNDPNYFWGRLSATAPSPFNGSASSGSNFGPSNETLRQNIETRIKLLRDADPENKNLVPVDLVTASASGLDPHISTAAALFQVPRVARLRNMPQEDVTKLVSQNTQKRLLGVIGEPVVNVLQLNIALDELKK